jgi:hypothetical protein
MDDENSMPLNQLENASISASRVRIGNIILGPVSIKVDGSIEIAEGVNVPEAAEAFWHCVEKLAPIHTHARILGKVREIAALKRHPSGPVWTIVSIPSALLREIDDELTFIK